MSALLCPRRSAKSLVFYQGSRHCDTSVVQHSAMAQPCDFSASLQHEVGQLLPRESSTP